MSAIDLVVLGAEVLGGLAVGFGAGRWKRTHDNKIGTVVKAEVPPGAIPSGQKLWGRGDPHGYRNSSPQAVCAVCQRACIHCRKKAKRRSWW